MPIIDPFLSNKKKFHISYILIGFVYLIFFISLGLLAALYFRPIYYACIKLFDISGKSGFSIDVIKENYNALIDYCFPFFTGELVFPSLTASAEALSHFKEVKTIFNVFFAAFFVSLIIICIYSHFQKAKKTYDYLRTSAIICLIVPFVTGVLCAVNFDYIFKLMHKILFNNDNWLFDPVADPVITILPQNFFLVCAAVIIFFVAAGSIILFIKYIRSKNKNIDEPLYHKKTNYIYK